MAQDVFAKKYGPAGWAEYIQGTRYTMNSGTDFNTNEIIQSFNGDLFSIAINIVTYNDGDLFQLSVSGAGRTERFLLGSIYSKNMVESYNFDLQEPIPSGVAIKTYYKTAVSGANIVYMNFKYLRESGAWI